MPKRIEFASTDTKLPLKTVDLVEASIEPGANGDRLFRLSEFPVADTAVQSSDLASKEPEGWGLGSILIGCGVLLVVLAVILRLRSERGA